MISLLCNHCWDRWWKNFENRSTFGKVMGKSRMSCLFDSQSV